MHGCVLYHFTSTYLVARVYLSHGFPLSFILRAVISASKDQSNYYRMLRQKTMIFTTSSTKCILGDGDLMSFVGLDLSRTGAEPRLIAGCLKNVFSSLSSDKAGALPLLLSKSIFCLIFFSVFFSISLRFLKISLKASFMASS